MAPISAFLLWNTFIFPSCKDAECPFTFISSTRQLLTDTYISGSASTSCPSSKISLTPTVYFLVRISKCPSISPPFSHLPPQIISLLLTLLYGSHYIMSSPPRFRPRRLSHTSSPSHSSTSSRQLPQSQDQNQNQPRPEIIKLHLFLQSTQEPVVEHIYSHILWDLRENPLTSAQEVRDLGKQLSPELLNAHATEPPVPFLTVVCEYPKPWNLVVSASAFNIGGNGGSANTVGSRNTFPVYPPQTSMSTGSPAPYLSYFRSSSASPQRLPMDGIPPTPIISTVPLPGAAAAANAAPKVGVTISDLLLAIYNHLHSKSVGSLELDALPSKQRIKVTEAFDKRSKMTQGIGDGESALVSPTSPTSATSPFYQPASSPSVTSVPVMAPPAASTSSATGAGEMKLVDTLLSHTLFAGMDVVPESEWTVSLSLKRPS